MAITICILSFICGLGLFVFIIKNLIKGRGKAPQNGKLATLWMMCTGIFIISLIIFGIQSGLQQQKIAKAKQEAYYKTPAGKAELAKKSADAAAKAKADAESKKYDGWLKEFENVGVDQKQAQGAVDVLKQDEADMKAKGIPADQVKIKIEQEKNDSVKSHKEQVDYVNWMNGLFSPWDGSIDGVNKLIKENMNNPDSFKHVSTTYENMGIGKGIKFLVTFRGQNAFGATITNQFEGTIDYKTNMINGHFVNQ